jgi:hypothetical protein
MSDKILSLAHEPASAGQQNHERFVRNFKAKLHSDRDFRQTLARNMLRHVERAAITPSTVHVDKFLTQLSIGYVNDEFVGEKLMPIVQVANRSDKFFKRNKRDLLNAPDDLSAARARANEVELTFAEDNYSVKDFHLQAYIDKMTEANADEAYLELVDMTEALTEQLALKREIRYAALLGVAGTYGASTAALTGAEWNEVGTTNDPLPTIQNILATRWSGGGRTKLVGVTTPEVLNVLINNAAIRGIFQYSTGGVPTKQQIASFMGLDEIHVAAARYDSANIGQTASYSRIWPAGIFIVARVMAAPSRRTTGLGATFRWSPGSATTQWFDPEPGNIGGTYTKVAVSEDLKVIDPVDSSYLLTGTIV